MAPLPTHLKYFVVISIIDSNTLIMLLVRNVIIIIIIIIIMKHLVSILAIRPPASPLLDLSVTTTR